MNRLVGEPVVRKLDRSPADGVNTAVNWRDCGMPRWQLSNKFTLTVVTSRRVVMPVGGSSTGAAIDEVAVGALTPEEPDMQTIATIDIEIAKWVF
jgi:hypothetical protein